MKFGQIITLVSSLVTPKFLLFTGLWKYRVWP